MSRQPRLFEPEVPIPEELREAVDLWLAYQREQWRFTYKPLALAILLERMSAWGPERALIAVKWSMGGSGRPYKGLFEPPKGNGCVRQDEDADLQWTPGLFCSRCKTPGPPTEEEAGGWCIWRENGKGRQQELAYAPLGALRVLCPECRR